MTTQPPITPDEYVALRAIAVVSGGSARRSSTSSAEERSLNISSVPAIGITWPERVARSFRALTPFPLRASQYNG